MRLASLNGRRKEGWSSRSSTRNLAGPRSHGLSCARRTQPHAQHALVLVSFGVKAKAARSKQLCRED